jgi:hypothetical protein
MKIRWPCILMAIVALAGATSSFAAQIVFSNLIQPGDQYGPDGVGLGAIPVPGTFIQYATKFTPSVTSKLSNFQLPLGLISGPNNIDVFLMADAAGSPAGVIEMFHHLLNLPPAFGGLIPLSTVTSATNPVLSAGTQYWVVAPGGTSTTFAQWALTLFAGDPTDGGATKVIQNGIDSGWVVGPGTRTGALRVSGDAVPEPGSVSLIIIGFATIAVVALRRREA